MLKGDGGSAAHHIGDPKLRAMVEEQEKRKREAENPISAETIYLWNLFQLKKQGYPFERDELPVQTWYDFAIVESVINEIQAEEIKKH